MTSAASTNAEGQPELAVGGFSGQRPLRRPRVLVAVDEEQPDPSVAVADCGERSQHDRAVAAQEDGEPPGVERGEDLGATASTIKVSASSAANPELGLRRGSGEAKVTSLTSTTGAAREREPRCPRRGARGVPYSRPAVTRRLTGVPFALVFAVWLGLMGVVPQIGGLLAAFPTVLLATLHSPQAGGIVLAAFLFYQQIENHLLGQLAPTTPNHGNKTAGRQRRNGR